MERKKKPNCERSEDINEDNIATRLYGQTAVQKVISNKFASGGF